MHIATRLVEIFRDATAKDVSEISHVKGGPWRKPLATGGPNSKIDFLSALVPVQDGEYLHEETLREKVKEFDAVTRSLS